MAITQSGQNPIIVSTAAKDSRLLESVLAAQGAISDDQIVVPNVIGTNNQSNLESTPTYSGRLIMLRPSSTKVSTVFIKVGGTGYAVNDPISVTGGTSQNPCTLNVDAVSGGVVTAISVKASVDQATPDGPGSYTVEPSNPVATTGGGSGLTLNLLYESNEEVRYINAGNTTLTVTENWDQIPVRNEDWALSYIIEDQASVSGTGILANRLNDYVASKVLEIGDATNFAWMAYLDGRSLETDGPSDKITAPIIVLNAGRFDSGYLLGDLTVQGGYVVAAADGQSAQGDWSFDARSGSITRWYDFFWTSADRFSHQWTGDIDFRNSKFVLSTAVSDWRGTSSNLIRLKDIIIQGRPNNSGTLPDVNEFTQIDGMLMITTAGFTVATGEVESLPTISNPGLVMRRVTYVSSQGHIQFTSISQQWVTFIDVVGLIEDLTHIFIATSGLGTEVRRKYSFNTVMAEVDGTVIEFARLYIFEGTLNDDLPAPNQVQSDSTGALSTDVLHKVYTNPSGSLVITTHGDHAIRIYKYGFVPIIALILFDEPIVRTDAMIVDVQIAAADEDTAIQNAAGITVTRHETGETDPRPLKVLNYDAGTGSVPTLGEIMTEGSATGVVVEFIGDAVSGTLVLQTWNGTEFTDNQTITGGTSSFSAQTNLVGGSSFYEEYTWLVAGDGNPMGEIYDYLAAKMAGRIHPLALLDDGGAFPLTDFTNEALDDDTGDVDLMPATPATNDAFYFGDEQVPFESITVDVGTAATTSILAWEYWNGSAFTALAGVVDDTDDFTTAGVNDVTYTYPSDWVKTQINGVDAYWIRARQTAGSPAGQPIADEISIDDQIFEEVVIWGEDEQSQLLYAPGVSPGFTTERNVALTEGVWISDHGVGTVSYLTADDGTQFVPAVALTITFTELVSGSEVRVCLTGTNTEVDGVESSGTSFGFAISSGVAVDYIILGPLSDPKVPIRVENISFTQDTTIVINQLINRVFSDPG